MSIEGKVRAIERITRLVGQVEAMSWGERTLNSKWLLERLLPIKDDVNWLAGRPFAEPRDNKGRFRKK